MVAVLALGEGIVAAKVQEGSFADSNRSLRSFGGFVWRSNEAQGGWQQQQYVQSLLP